MLKAVSLKRATKRKGKEPAFPKVWAQVEGRHLLPAKKVIEEPKRLVPFKEDLMFVGWLVRATQCVFYIDKRPTIQNIRKLGSPGAILQSGGRP
jgi:hypothetical protein